MTESKEKNSIWIIGLTLLFPSLITLIYFVFGEWNPTFQKMTFLLGKTIQFGFPVFWTAWILKERWFIRRFQTKGIVEGAIFGTLVFVAMIGFFYLLHFFPEFSGSLEKMKLEISKRLTALGLFSPIPYLILSLFYCVVHSGLEEYYWRWFTFRLIYRNFPWLIAAVITNIGFAIHHVIILGSYFGFSSFLTWFCVLGVFVGGFYWSILYRRSDSIYAPWLSHGIVDAAIFVIGFLIMMGS